MISYSENPSWQQRLFALANDPQCNPVGGQKQISSTMAEQNFRRAVTACEAITAEYSRSFNLASGLLPVEKRRAMRVLYAFCRIADNLADEDVEQPEAKLRALREGILGLKDAGDDAVLSAWTEIQRQHQIPLCYAEQLLDGVARDLVQQRYRRFEDLAVYCYGVASTVGLMSMHITGFSNRQAVPYAIKLGVALQLTNILRDVGEDWNAGRLYLPLDELAAFGLAEHDVAAASVDGRWRQFMRFQIDRARRLYAEAMPGIALLHRDGRFAVSAAALLYRGILDDIQAHDFDVFNRRAYVNRSQKIRLLLRAFAYTQEIRLKMPYQFEKV